MPAPTFLPERVSAVNLISRFRFHNRRLVLAGLLLIACSPKGSGIGDYSPSLDPAVELFVQGRYEEAASAFEALSDRVRSKDGLVELYLYLGRAYMAMGQYDRAIDAFAAGVSYGGGGPFQEYLERLGRMKDGSPENIAKAETITRLQLALLIDRLVLGAGPDVDAPSGAGPSGETVNSDAVKNGIVTALPDGDFHGGDKVSRAAFYVVVCRLLDRLSPPMEAERIFPGGFGWATSPGPEADGFVSGKEAVFFLQKVAGAGERPHGG